MPYFLKNISLNCKFIYKTILHFYIKHVLIFICHGLFLGRDIVANEGLLGQANIVGESNIPHRLYIDFDMALYTCLGTPPNSLGF